MQSPEAVAALLKQADVFSLASYHFDNQPMTFLEAASSGLPIVYCDERMTEGLTPHNAILTSGIEGQDFATVFNELFSDQERLKALGRGSRQVARQFDASMLARKVVAVYQELIDARTAA